MDPLPALVPVPPNESPGQQYQSAERNWQGIPGIERTADGTLWSTWYSGGSGEGPDNYVVLGRSKDDGQTWTHPELVIDPPTIVRAFDPCLWVDPFDRLWLCWSQEHVKWDGRAGVWCILATEEDQYEHWQYPRRLCDGIMMNKPTVTRDGTWLFPATKWDRPPQVFAYVDAVELTPDALATLTFPVARSEAQTTVYASTDYGQTLRQRGGAKVPHAVANCDEHMTVELADGRLLMLIRTNYGIGQSDSSDGGRTWTPVRNSGITHPTTRFFVRRLNSGAILLVKHDHPDERTALTAYVSDDDGETWVGGLQLDDREGVSYPDGTEAPDGTIYLTYDRDRYGTGEILMARVTESDVRAGEPISANCRLQSEIDRIDQ